MATGTVTSSSSISTITGYCGYGEVRVGTNGDEMGEEPEVCVGRSDGVYEFGRRIWDSSLSNGFNTGLLTFNMTAKAGGGTNGLTTTVAGGETVVVYSGVTYGNISQVKVRAAVTTNALMKLTGLRVDFYKNNVVVDTYQASSDLAVDKRGSGDTATGESVLTVTPNANDNTKVVISGSFQMIRASSWLPYPTAIFGQVFVFAANCQGV